MQFFGALTALVTPFKNGAVDEAAYREFIEFQISEGIHGLVPCGTTGESATLSHEEHERVIEICIDQVKGRVPVLAGAGSNNTIEAIRLTRFAQKAGAAGALLITPYYNKPTQEGLYRHFKAIAEAVDMPLVPYNVPGRTGTNLLPATLSRLAHEFPNIVGVKEATGDMRQCSLIMEQCPKGFSLLSGDDFTALPLMSIGGSGVISVTSNIVPGKVAAMYNAFAKGDIATAMGIHHDLFVLHQAMFMESNPIPVKTALALMGRMTDEMRLPLCPLTDEHLERLKNVLASKGLLAYYGTSSSSPAPAGLFSCPASGLRTGPIPFPVCRCLQPGTTVCTKACPYPSPFAQAGAPSVPSFLPAEPCRCLPSPCPAASMMAFSILCRGDHP